MDHIFTFTRLHIPSGQTLEETRAFISRAEFLAALNEWNRQQPGVWQYYAYDTLGRYGTAKPPPRCRRD